MRYHQCSIMLVQLQGYISADIQVHYNIILMYVYNIYLGISSPPQFPDACQVRHESSQKASRVESGPVQWWTGVAQECRPEQRRNVHQSSMGMQTGVAQESSPEQLRSSSVLDTCNPTCQATLSILSSVIHPSTVSLQVHTWHACLTYTPVPSQSPTATVSLVFNTVETFIWPLDPLAWLFDLFS